MKRKASTTIAFWLIFAVSAAISMIFVFRHSQPDPVLYGAYDVVRVVDGDTIIVLIEGKETTIRMIGIDTPESVHPDSSRNTENGKIASEYTAELLTGKQVYLEYDRERTDSYGRTLAYVWLNHEMVEEILLANGMAEVLTIQPNTRYEMRFVRIEQQAKENKAGFWQDGL